LALGGTASLTELYQRAGAKLAFDAETLRASVSLIESTLEELEAQNHPFMRCPVSIRRATDPAGMGSVAPSRFPCQVASV